MIINDNFILLLDFICINLILYRISMDKKFTLFKQREILVEAISDLK